MRATKIHSVISLALLCLTSFAVNDTAASYEISGGFYDNHYRYGYSWFSSVWEYKVVDGGACLTNHYAILGDVKYPNCPLYGDKHCIIPATLGGYPVTRIGKYACWCEYYCESLSIPDTVTVIEEGAFGYLAALLEGQDAPDIIIPDSVRDIGNYAFLLCSNTKKVVIGNGVTNISYEAFEECYSLEELHLGSNVKSIGESAFANCYNMKSTHISLAGLTKIGKSAFVNCRNLTDIALPDGIEEIPAGVFIGCSGLEHIVLPKNVKVIHKAFSGCASLKEITIPAKVEKFVDEVFSDCSSLQKVIFQGTPPLAIKNRGSDIVFKNVATGAKGFYPVRHREEWEKVIDQTSGMWEGLIMEEIKSSIPNFTVYLSVKEASPATGTMTLQWGLGEKSEESLNGAFPEGTTFAVYRGPGETRLDTYLVPEAQSLTETEWKDYTFYENEPVLEPMNYWVVANVPEEGKEAPKVVESDRLTTRRRFVLSVGLSEFESPRLDRLPQPAADATLFAKLASQTVCPPCLNENATTNEIRESLHVLAKKAKPGDIVLFFIATHGGYSEELGIAGLCTYEYGGHYWVKDLSEDVSRFDSGVAFIGTIMACHSQAMVDSIYVGGDANNPVLKARYDYQIKNDLAKCTPNVAWIVSSSYNEISVVPHDSAHSQFGEWFLNQGWNRGYADVALAGVGYKGGDGNGKLTFGELARYAAAFSKGVSDKRSSSVITVQDEDSRLLYPFSKPLLDSIVIATNVAPDNLTIPSAPSDIETFPTDSCVMLSWSPASRASLYWVYRLKEGCEGNEESDWECVSYMCCKTSCGDTEFGAARSAPGDVRQYRVKAVNFVGASDPSQTVPGFRGSTDMFDFLRKAGKKLLSAESSLPMIARTIANNGFSIEQCFIAGLDPADPQSRFMARLEMVDGKPVVKWTPDLNEDGAKAVREYRVLGKRTLGADEDWTDVTNVADLEAAGFRFFRVSVDFGEPGEDDEVTTALAAPGGVAASRGTSDSGIAVSWNGVGGAESYEVWRRYEVDEPIENPAAPGSGAAPAVDDPSVLVATTTETEWTDATASPGMEYHYEIVAVAADGTSSERSEGAIGVRSLPRPSMTATAADSGDSIRATLKADWFGGSVEFLRNTVNDPATATVVGGSSPWNDTIDCGRTYYYWARYTLKYNILTPAVSETFTFVSDCSEPVSVRVPLGTPQNLTAVGTADGNVVSWSPVPHATSYEIYRVSLKLDYNETTGAISGSWLNTLVGTATATSFTDTGATVGETIQYAVVAVADDVSSDMSARVPAARPPAAPVAEKKTTTTRVGSRTYYYASLSWEAVEGATGYRVYYGATDVFSEDLANAETSELRMQASSLGGSSSYVGYFWIRALAGEAESELSGPY